MQRSEARNSRHRASLFSRTNRVAQEKSFLFFVDAPIVEDLLDELRAISFFPLSLFHFTLLALVNALTRFGEDRNGKNVNGDVLIDRTRSTSSQMSEVERVFALVQSIPSWNERTNCLVRETLIPNLVGRKYLAEGMD